MAWICEQEGIEADPEALAVLAAGRRRQRARFALRARPGHRLLRRQAGRRRSARTARRVLARIAREGHRRRWPPAIRAACSKWWRSSSATGRTCSTSAASWRATSAICWSRGSPEPDTRLVAASAAQREKLAAIAGGFSEEDLTRYLQLSLDMFKDLQASLQPRFHLEIGLVRLVQAGRLMPIEEALAGLGAAAPARAPAAAASSAAHGAASARHGPAALRPVALRTGPRQEGRHAAARAAILRRQRARAASPKRRP